MPMMGHIGNQTMFRTYSDDHICRRFVRESSKWTDVVLWCNKGRYVPIVALHCFVPFRKCLDIHVTREKNVQVLDFSDFVDSQAAGSQ